MSVTNKFKIGDKVVLETHGHKSTAVVCKGTHGAASEGRVACNNWSDGEDKTECYYARKDMLRHLTPLEEELL